MAFRQKDDSSLASCSKEGSHSSAVDFDWDYMEEWRMLARDVAEETETAKRTSMKEMSQ